MVQPGLDDVVNAALTAAKKVVDDMKGKAWSGLDNVSQQDAKDIQCCLERLTETKDRLQPALSKCKETKLRTIKELNGIANELDCLNQKMDYFNLGSSATDLILLAFAPWTGGAYLAGNVAKIAFDYVVSRYQSKDMKDKCTRAQDMVDADQKATKEVSEIHGQFDDWVEYLESRMDVLEKTKNIENVSMFLDTVKAVVETVKAARETVMEVGETVKKVGGTIREVGERVNAVGERVKAVGNAVKAVEGTANAFRDKFSQGESTGTLVGSSSDTGTKAAKHAPKKGQKVVKDATAKGSTKLAVGLTVFAAAVTVYGVVNVSASIYKGSQSEPAKHLREWAKSLQDQLDVILLLEKFLLQLT